MAKCKACADGSIECGPINNELCLQGGGWQPAGVIALRLYVARGKSGACKIKVEPCIPVGSFRCATIKCPPAHLPIGVVRTRAGTVVKKTSRKSPGKAVKKAVKKTARKTVRKKSR